jgi:HNH endonuclease/NUMOD4 motif
MEIWKEIPQASKYEASNYGNIRLKTGKILSQFKSISYPGGYFLVRIVFDNRKPTNRLVHRLIAQTFHDNPDNKSTVNHKNGDKMDNHVDNLEWNTFSENNQHAYDMGLKKYRPLHYKGKFGNEHNRSKSVECIETGVVYGSMSEAARLLDIDVSSVSLSCKSNIPVFGMNFKINQ